MGLKGLKVKPTVRGGVGLYKGRGVGNYTEGSLCSVFALSLSVPAFLSGIPFSISLPSPSASPNASPFPLRFAISRHPCSVFLAVPFPLPLRLPLFPSSLSFSNPLSLSLSCLPPFSCSFPFL